MALGVAVAVPLGILLTEYDRLSKYVIGCASALQTIPSLALLAIMVPLLGVGKLPAIIALFIYSLLPILRNTYIGIKDVSPATVDAAKGMGMTALQVITKIKIPLAAPVIMSGIRLSGVYVISWTALAAYIGAGGLGDYILAGLNTYNIPMTLWGTLPVTLLAIITDQLLGRGEQLVTPITANPAPKNGGDHHD